MVTAFLFRHANHFSFISLSVLRIVRSDRLVCSGSFEFLTKNCLVLKFTSISFKLFSSLNFYITNYNSAWKMASVEEEGTDNIVKLLEMIQMMEAYGMSDEGPINEMRSKVRRAVKLTGWTPGQVRSYILFTHSES